MIPVNLAPPSVRLLISVVVPTFNSERHLRNCLESLREQTYQNYEVVVVDGGSTDGTVRIIEEQAALFPRIIWRSEKDRGVYDAMNKGVALARGDWLLFLGSDDALYAPDVLAKMAPHLSQEYNLVYGNVFSASASSWAPAGVVYDGEFNDEKILERNICHQAIFYSRALFDQHRGYDQSYKVLGDWEFNLRIFRTARKKFVDLIVARFEGGGMSTSIIDHEFNLRFPEIVDRAFRLPLRAAFYRARRAALIRLAGYHWQRGQRLLSTRFFWIWLINLEARGIWEQAREAWYQRRAADRST